MLSLGMGLTGLGRLLGIARTYVILLIGQSNMVGQGLWDDGIDYPTGVMQLNQSGELVQAAHRLHHITASNDRFGLALQFVLDWLEAHPSDRLVLVPCAEGGTGFYTEDWEVGQPNYEQAVSQMNIAMAMFPQATPIVLWHQGEADADGGGTWVSDYPEHLDALIAGIRSEIIGGSYATPFIVGELGPYGIANDADVAAVNGHLNDTPNRVPFTSCVSSDGLSQWPDNVHFDAPAVRTLGSRYYAAVEALMASTLPAQVAAVPGQNRIIDVSDVTSLFVERNGTGGNPNPGDPVGLIVYKDGMGEATAAAYMEANEISNPASIQHAEAPSDGQRPIYQTDGTRHWLEFDGVNDTLVMGIPNRSLTTRVIAGIETADTQGMLISGTPSSVFAGLWWDDNATAQTGTVAINGASCTTRDATWEALEGGPAVFDLQLNTAQSSNWNDTNLLYFGNGHAYTAAAKLYGVFWTDTSMTAAQVDLVNRWIAGLAGVTPF